MSKPIIVPDIRYISPRQSARGSGYKGLKSFLKYVQYREDQHIQASPDQLQDRWQDRGLGVHYREIYTQCSYLKNQHVLAWTWVVSPAPDLMQLVPEDKRRDLVMDVTEHMVEAYYEKRGFHTPPYSYVLHDRSTEDGDQQLHTHVVLPGLAPTVEGWEPMFVNKHQDHVELFNTIAHEQFEQALDRTIGREWRQLRPDPEVKPDLPLDSDDLNQWFPR